MQNRVDAALRQFGLNVTGEQVLGGPFPFKKGIQMTDSEAAHEQIGRFARAELANWPHFIFQVRQFGW